MGGVSPDLQHFNVHTCVCEGVCEGVLHSRKEPLAKGRAAFAVCGLLALGVLPALVLCRQAPMTEGAVPKIPKKPKAR